VCVCVCVCVYSPFFRTVTPYRLVMDAWPLEQHSSLISRVGISKKNWYFDPGRWH